MVQSIKGHQAPLLSPLHNTDMLTQAHCTRTPPPRIILLPLLHCRGRQRVKIRKHQVVIVGEGLRQVLDQLGHAGRDESRRRMRGAELFCVFVCMTSIEKGRGTRGEQMKGGEDVCMHLCYSP